MLPKARKHFSSSILLWMRGDRPRQASMDYWSGPHSGIIAATPGFDLYRQIHLAEANPGRWPATDGVETRIPVDRKVDGVAEVTFRSVAGPLLGRRQNKIAYRDEVNVFRRTLLYSGLPGWSRRYDEAAPGERPGARTYITLSRRPGIGGRQFRRFIDDEFALAGTGSVTELRTQTFMPWVRWLWPSPDVAHDNPPDQRFHASVIIGFTDEAARAAFYGGVAESGLSTKVARFASAVHAYDVFTTLTFVRNGVRLPHFEVD